MRKLAALAVAMSLACVPAAPTARAEGAIPRDRAFVERVNEAIERGAAWLRGRVLRDGSFGEFPAYPGAQTAMAYLTLRVCGVPREDAQMERTYATLRREIERAWDDDRLRTYTAALAMMAIEQHGRPAAPGDGAGAHETRLDDADRDLMRDLVRFLDGNQTSGGGWRYGSKVGRYSGARVNDADYDHSNTQYALLGLKSASRCGVEVDADVYLKALRHLIEAQQPDGPEVPRVAFGEQGTTFADARDRARGWGYFTLENERDGGPLRRARASKSPAYGSMTAGSLGAVVICRSELLGRPGYPRSLDAEAETAIWDGIAWLGRNFSVSANPHFQGWHLYYLYALERAGVLAGVDWMGEHDWYLKGAEHLLGAQQADGSWRDAGSDLVNTCFALLFLKRGTLPVARGAVTPSGGADTIDFGAARGLTGKALEDFVDLVLSRWRRGTSATSREALRRGLASVGEPVVLPLLARMATGRDEAREAAHWFAAGITGVSLAYDPAAAVEARYDALTAWEEWYMARAGRLRFDAGSGTLVAR